MANRLNIVVYAGSVSFFWETADKDGGFGLGAEGLGIHWVGHKADGIIRLG